MDVIRHQAIAEQRQAVPLGALAKGVEIEAAIVAEQEDVLAVVAPLCDVVRHARRHNTSHAGVDP